MRIVITSPGPSYEKTYITPPLTDEMANALASVLAATRTCNRDRIGDYQSDHALITDPTTGLRVELVADDVALTRKQFAAAQAEFAADASRKAAEKAKADLDALNAANVALEPAIA